MQPADVVPGQVLAGRYRVDRVLGAGGMGVVIAATHTQLNRKVALKFLLPEAMKADSVARFLREAQAVAQIQSEHVAKVSDFGTLENGAPYMVMEYLDGADLAHVLVQRGPLPIEEIVEYVLQACEVLAEAHSYGIIHRDLKPANLFVTRRIDGSPCVKVLDFGISKLLSAQDHVMTKTGGMLGSPLYMSPEQVMNAKDVDARADVWSLGVIMYELAAGTPPFIAEELPQLIFAIVQGNYEPLAVRRPDIPEAFAAAVQGCLANDRNARFSNISAIAKALEPIAPARARRSIDVIRAISLPTNPTAPMQVLTSQPPPAPSRPPAPVVTQPPTTAQTHAAFGSTAGTGSTVGTGPGNGSSKSLLLVGGGVLALALVGGVAFGLGRAGTAPQKAETEPSASPAPPHGESKTPASSTPFEPTTAAPEESAAPPLPSPPSAASPQTAPSTQTKSASALSAKATATTAKATASAALPFSIVGLTVKRRLLPRHTCTSRSSPVDWTRNRRRGLGVSGDVLRPKVARR